MLKKIIKYSLVAVFVASANLYALAPLDILEDGKRAFELAQWEQAREILERFIETWPEHDKYNEALYFYTLASAKTIDNRTETYRSKLGKELESAVASLSLDLSDSDLSEAKVAIKLASKPIKPELWKDLIKLTPSELKHYLARGWYPEPTNDPYSTLEWTKMKLSDVSNIDSETISNIALIKLSALWKILQSPLALNSSEEKLESLGCFPIEKVFNQTLHLAFKKGNPDQKRKVAIYGYHFDYFRNNTLVSKNNIKSQWLRYLKSRGLIQEKTWSP